MTVATVSLRIDEEDELLSESQYIMPKYPTLFEAIDGKPFPNSTNAVPVTNGSYIFLQVINDDAVEHVFHLHGHTFWVLHAGKILHAPITRKSIVKFDNTQRFPRRDAIQVPPCSGGKGGGGENGCLKGIVNLLIHFDNPGVWLFHCHIEWHMQAGLSFTFVNSDGLAELGKSVPSEFIRSCKNRNSMA